MAWIELSEEDRKKYDAPERIEVNYGEWGLKSIDALEREVGWTLEDLGNELQRKRYDKHGDVVTRDELDDDGNPVLHGDGKPKQIEVEAPSKLALTAVAWMALRAIGIRIPWDDFDIQSRGFRVNWGDSEGKAEESSEEPPA